MKQEQEQKLQAISSVVGNVMPPRPYHNFAHALEVYHMTRQLGALNNTNESEQFLLNTAALLHDVIYIPFNEDNEEKSAKFSGIYLPQLGYTPGEIEVVSRLILSTKMPQKPKGLLAEIICDADLDNLGRPDFFEKGEKLKEELDLPSEGWYVKQMAFLSMHEYHTQPAKRMREKGKKENIKRLERMMVNAG